MTDRLTRPWELQVSARQRLIRRRSVASTPIVVQPVFQSRRALDQLQLSTFISCLKITIARRSSFTEAPRTRFFFSLIP